MISNSNLSVEDIVQALCPNCGEVKNHTVIKAVDERTSRIRCNTCRTTGIFNGKKVKPAARKAKKAPTSRKSLEAIGTKEREAWASLRPGMEPEKAVTYSMTGTYHVRDLVQHGSFGLGLVMREAGPHKIEVLFEEGKKLLCCH